MALFFGRLAAMKHVNRSAPKIGSLLWSTCDLANRKFHILSTKRGIKEISGERILGSAPKIHLEETDRVVKRTETIVNVSGGDNLLNRVVDALGNSIDENEALSSEQKFRVGIKAPGTNPRVSVCDVSAYIPTNVIPITNGQIFLLTGLLYKGIRPGINVAAQRRFYSTSGKPNDESSPLDLVENFKTLLEKEIYVDKTNFLGRIMRYGSIVILRPPGFGKSIMSSMMKYFFECGPNGTDNSMKIHEEFKAYSVMTHDCPGNKKARSLAGKSYVLYYDFRNVNEERLQRTISNAYSRGHQMAVKLLDGNHEVQTDAMDFTIDELKTKCNNIIVIIDEFDTPLNAALARLQVSSGIESKREEAKKLMGEYIAFLGSLYGAATHLILFGRLVVNYNALVRHNTRLLLRLNTLIRPGEFHQDFGFTQEEIEKFPCKLENIEKLRKQFGGYGRDGTLFNSRSFYEKCFTKTEEFPTPLGATAILPFFVNNDIILKTLIQLVNDQQIKCQLKHLPLYRDITESYYTLEEAMAVFCVLGLVTTTQNPEHDNLLSFRITNEECKRTIQERIISTETLKYTKEFERMSELVLAIQKRDWDLFSEVFGRYILNFPFARIHMQEAVVHCTLGGVLYHMQHSVECQEWVVQSDNSAGHGRYDHIWFSTNPKDTHAIIFEYGRDLHGNPEAEVTKKYNQIMKMKYQEAFFPYKHINMYDIVVIIFAPNGRRCTTKFYRNIPYTRYT